jgi:hypothetical protein
MKMNGSPGGSGSARSMGLALWDRARLVRRISATAMDTCTHMHLNVKTDNSNLLF